MATTRTTPKSKPAPTPNGKQKGKPGDPLPERIPNHPLAKVLGCCDDIPQDVWDEFMEEVRKIRQRHAEEDAAELDALEEAKPMPTTRTTKKTKTQASPNGAATLRPGEMQPEPVPNHPLARTIGALNNEPMWEEVMEEVRKFREEFDRIEEEEDAA